MIVTPARADAERPSCRSGKCAARVAMTSRLRAAVALAAAAAALCAALWLAGAWLSRSAARDVGPPPADLPAQAVSIESLPGESVSGWFVRGVPGQGAVLLLHGLRADRRQMLPRARMLHRAGYSVLLVDLPAHGRSSGSRIGFGLSEAAGSMAALAYLRTELPDERIGVIGVSLGAAALVLSGAAHAADAAVLESMYPSLREAAANRLVMRFGPAGEAAVPLLMWSHVLHHGVGADRLRPIDAMPVLDTPVLVAAGSADRHTPAAETLRIYAAALPPKQLWLVPGAAHVDLHAHDREAYEATVLAFMAKYLRGTGR